MYAEDLKGAADVCSSIPHTLRKNGWRLITRTATFSVHLTFHNSEIYSCLKPLQIIGKLPGLHEYAEVLPTTFLIQDDTKNGKF